MEVVLVGQILKVDNIVIYEPGEKSNEPDLKKSVLNLILPNGDVI
jgi:hypothetical protein